MQRAEEAAGKRYGAFMQFVARGSNMLAGLLRGQAWKNTEQAAQAIYNPDTKTVK